MAENNVKQKLVSLSNKARILGLSANDLGNAQEALNHDEYEVCLDIIVNQIYEYETKIDSDFYFMVNSICEDLRFNKQKYNFLNELFKN